MSTIKNLKIKPIEKQTEELYTSTKLDFLEAKGDEVRNWKERKVYLKVEDKAKKCVSSRWVTTVKNDGDKMKLKSRLIAKRFEEDCLEEIPKYSPTIDKSSLKAAFPVIAQHNWSVNIINIKTAFLQGEEFERNVYIRQSPVASSKKIWKLR